MKEMNEAFDNKKYLQAQQEAFEKALTRDSNRSVFLEFGGKPFSDKHAERVLPGYEADAKAEILRETIKLADIVMVVNALDILQRPDGRTLRGRIRGDTQLTYDKETIRMLKDAHARKIPITKVVMAVTPGNLSDGNLKLIQKFRGELEDIGVRFIVHNKLDGYPDPSTVNMDSLGENASVRSGSKNLIAVSPGGGSGKFGVLLSEMYDALRKGEIPEFVKFETFPIFQLDAKHALNLAFEAATADLRNKVIDLEKRDGELRTSYDKDIENYALLRKLFIMFGKDENLRHLKDPVDFGVNQVVQGIVNMDQIIEACHAEIIRRIRRYEMEVKNGIEKVTTLEAAIEILGKFETLYQIKT